MSICPPSTGSTSSTATSTTSMPRRSRKTRTEPGVPEEIRPARRARLQGHERG
jgi:hypothetical protein